MSQWISNPLAAQFPKSYAACDLQKDSKSIIPPIDAKPKDVRSKSKNLAVFVSTKRNQFLTQDSVEGQLQINCTSAKSLKIGKITVSLIGIEGTG